MKAGKEALEQLLGASPDEAAAILREMEGEALNGFLSDWPAWVHEGQEAPEERRGRSG